MNDSVLHLRSTTTQPQGGNLNEQIHSEVLTHIHTPKKSVPYYRELGNDIMQAENKPLTAFTFILFATQIREGLALFNNNNSKQERRVVLPLSNIEIDDADRHKGEANIFIRYIRVKDLVEVANEK